MSKGLEMLNDAKENLEEIDNHVGFDYRFEISEIKYDFSVIEKELKDYYALKKECNESKWYQEHMALEAIKSIEGFVDEEDFFYDDEEDKYYFFGYKISKEKFELLKEVLL